MIKKETLIFFREIAEHNNKPWFELNKSRYEKIKADYLDFIALLLKEIRKIEPIHEKDRKKYADRIYRDIRFSKDKSPYKRSISSLIERAPDGKKCPFYIHIEPGNSFAGGGVWQPEPDLLKKVRQEIDYNGSVFNAIINKQSFKDTFGELTGETLIRPPQGYDNDNPNIALIKLKQYIVRRHFTDDEVTSPQFLDKLIHAYTEAQPFYSFFDAVKQEG
ncbi:MAG: DUF2461 domain-containing protein [Mucilaginibacter sp.]